MCTRRLLSVASIFVVLATMSACGNSDRTGSEFCAQLGKELPAIAQPMATTKDVSAMVNRYERLLERAPLTIESDLAVFTDLLKQAARLNPKDATEVQELADASYRANKSSINVRDWVKSTCAVDISTGQTIAPMRIATTTSVAPATSVAPVAPVAPAPVATTVP